MSAVVMDCGTGYSKIGFAGNLQPSFTFPSCTAVSETSKVRSNTRSIEINDLGVQIGHEAIDCSATHTVTFPIRQGLVENWDQMELLWQQSIYQYLQVDPEEHAFLLTEAPMNTPENRELTAEVMFETFNVPALFIGVQAVLALYANYAAAERKQEGAGRTLSGIVVDAGEGLTHIIPVVDSYVLEGSIKSIPIAGRDVTLFIQQLMRERGEPIPPEMSLEVCRQIKEKFGYTCGDIVKEFAKHEQQPENFVKQYVGFNMRTGKEFTADVGYESFLGPEIFFTPQIASTVTTPLPILVDDVIQSCPIDTRRSLYNNIVLSGGSTMMRGFAQRLEREAKHVANSRLLPEVKPIAVNVVRHNWQQYAVWFGGSILGMAPEFPKACHTKEEYMEHGPSICRSNYIFRDI